MCIILARPFAPFYSLSCFYFLLFKGFRDVRDDLISISKTYEETGNIKRERQGNNQGTFIHIFIILLSRLVLFWRKGHFAIVCKAHIRKNSSVLAHINEVQQQLDWDNRLEPTSKG